MIIKRITIKYKPLFKWSRSYDMYILGTRLNEVIDSNNDFEHRLAAVEKNLGITRSTAPKPD